MTTKKENCNICERIGLRPFNKNNILYYYAPLHGMLSYGALSVNVTNPSFFVRLIPHKDLTQFLLGHTIVGASLYFYSRPHLQNVEVKKRIAYSITGSGLLGLGSILLWAIIRSAIPNNNALATAIGLGSGYAIVRLGYDYLDHIDSSVAKAK